MVICRPKNRTCWFLITWRLALKFIADTHVAGVEKILKFRFYGATKETEPKSERYKFMGHKIAHKTSNDVFLLGYSRSQN